MRHVNALLIVLLLATLTLGTSCRTTPLDNIWPGCTTCAPPPAPAPTPCPPPQQVPWSVEIDERISPVVDCNPIRTQHTLVATVLDQCGNPIPGQRVEWILNRYPEAVGDIVAVDDQYGVGAIAPVSQAHVGNNGNKFDNQYAVSVTNYGPEMIDAGNNHPYVGANGSRLPDITIGRGQSWIVMTSTREGVTDLTVYVPAIRDGARHKIWAKKVWADFAVDFPEDAVNTLPEGEHPFPVTVSRSDGSGIPGQPVEAEILDGPEAVFVSSGNRMAAMLTNANGIAEFRLRNTAGMSGTNRVRFTANGTFYGEVCPRSAIVTKRWQQVALEVSCTYPGGNTVAVNRPFEKVITVTNRGDAPAMDVVLEDRPGGGLSLVNPEAVPIRVGTVAPGQSVSRTVRLLASTEGHYINTVIARTADGSSMAEATCPVEAVQGNLEITKICEPTRVSVGGEVMFVVNVANTGRGPLENVIVVDDFPEGIDPASQDSITVGTLAPGETREITFMGTTQQAGTFTNTARAAADGSPERTATCTVQVVECRLEMDLVGPGQVYYGDQANFTVRVRNVGDGDAEACMVRVTTGECLGSVVQDFVVGPLGAGESWTQDFAGRAAAVGSCTVDADSDCGARCQIRQDVVLKVTGLPALQVEMTDKGLDGTEEGIFRTGETFLYRLTVWNDEGTEATPAMRVIWQLPPELEFVAGRSDGRGEVSGSGTSARSTDFALDISQSMTFELQVRVLSAPAAGLVKTIARVERSDGVELASESESTTLKD